MIHVKSDRSNDVKKLYFQNTLEIEFQLNTHAYRCSARIRKVQIRASR